jgi:acylphosphatase
MEATLPDSDNVSAKLPESPPAPPERVHLRVRGQVQGVYYRSAATEQARVLGLRGVVRNLACGDVELIAEGPRSVLQQLIDWCHLGPPAAQVAQVEVCFFAATHEYVDFRVLRSPTGTAPVLPTEPPGSGT